MSLADIQSGIAAACHDAGRKPGDVALVAVSKMQPDDRVQALLDAGHRLFGENKVQEAQARWTALRKRYPDLCLHFIGRLQSNKARDAVALFDVIETVDSARLADALAAEMKKQSRRLPCFIQVNTGEEEQKGGVAPRDLPALLEHCRKVAQIDVTGLMCIPPEGDVPDLHFALLHKLAGENGLPQLSMGMSGDYEIAIRYGATHVRVGSALFGSRQP